MNILKKIANWLSGLFKPDTTLNEQKKSLKKIESPVVFSTVSIVEKPPKNEDVAEHEFFFVILSNKPKWSLFKCPCGCGDVITLSLQPVHIPHWCFTKSQAERPTLYPSIWRDKGCLSHFWLKDGRIFWCHDTGSSPFSKTNRDR
jgi:hypothetical protein